MVITLDKRKQPLGFCTERRARILISKGRACVHKYYPFTIIVKDADTRQTPVSDEYRIKIDPGANHTGLAIIKESTNEVVYYIQIQHRASFIVEAMKTRANSRRNRRQRETRYRPCKWINHYLPKGSKYKADSPRPKGWLPPSVKSIGDNILSWVIRLRRLIHITKCSFEAVRFDTQKMDDPEIEGVEYQHGTLFGREIKEYLLSRYKHTCQYCNGESGDSVLEWEHIVPKSKGGSDSVKNATLACHTCNQEKDDLLLPAWLAQEQVIIDKPHGYRKARKKLAKARVKGIKQVMERKSSYGSDRYCAWANVNRKYVEKGLFDIFGDVECSSGGRTKYNRTNLGLPKDHHYDALCVGVVPQSGYIDRTNSYCLYIEAVGRGQRLRGNINKCGIIVLKYPKGPKRRLGFTNGDIVEATVQGGKRKGCRYVGRVMTRQDGRFEVRTINGELINATYKYCKVLQRDCGYQFSQRKGGAIPLGN